MKKFAIILILLSGTFCTLFAAQTKSVAPIRSGSEVQNGWHRHQDPAGFTVDIPSGWKITSEKQAGRILMQGPGSEQAMIWPSFVEKQQLDGNAAGALARQLARKLDPQMPWGAPENVSNCIRMVARGTQRKGVMLLTWANKANGSQIYVYSLSGPASSYHASLDQFAGIIESFRIDSPAAKPESGNEPFTVPAKYVRWMDPNENAFTLSVPEGWKIRGGSYRITAVDVRKGVNLFSPDGKVRVLYGDANISGFSLPTEMYSRLGMREGSYTALGDGTQLLIRRYVTGQQFAREYVETSMRDTCQNLRIVTSASRPDLAKSDAPLQAVPGVARVQTTAGDVTFSCTVNDQPLEGYVAAITRVYYSTVQGGTWSVEDLYGVFAPPQYMQQARSVGEKITSSFHLDPEWEAREKKISQAAVQQDNIRSQQIRQRALRAIQDDLHATTDAIVNGYNQRQAVYGEISRKRENAILGTVDVVDPASGKQYKIENYSDYHWMDNQGYIAGTKTADSPGPGWRQLIDLP